MGAGKRILQWTGFLVFAILSVVNLSYHPMWGDELQAWGIARASSSPVDLFGRIQFEGHPILWYLMLWPVAQLTGDPAAMQIVHSLLTWGWLALIWFRSPFSVTEKTLLCLSYPLLYDYAVFSRSYGLGVLLAFAFVSSRELFTARPWLGWVVLGLLANTHFFFAVASLALAVLWLSSAAKKKPLFQGVAIYAASLLFAAVTVGRSLRQGHSVVSWCFRFTADSLASKVAALGSAFCPISELDSGFFDAHLPLTEGLEATLLVVLAVCLYLRPQRVALATLLSVALVLVSFFYRVLGGHSWHAGVLFVVFVSLVWWLREQAAELGPPAIFTVLLAFNAVAGQWAALTAHAIALSRTQATARWIRQNGLEKEFWIGFPTFPTMGVATCLDRPFYFPESDRESTYVEWDRLWTTRQGDLAPRVGRAVALHGHAFLLVEGELKEPFRSALSGQVRVTEVVSLREAIFENYIIYRLNLPAK